MFMKDVHYNIFSLHVHHFLLQNHWSARSEVVQLFTYALLTLCRIEAKSFSVPQKSIHSNIGISILNKLPTLFAKFRNKSTFTVDRVAVKPSFTVDTSIIFHCWHIHSAKVDTTSIKSSFSEDASNRPMQHWQFSNIYCKICAIYIHFQSVINEHMHACFFIYRLPLKKAFN